MKILLLVAASFWSLCTMAFPISNGHYKGEGYSQLSGLNATYETELHLNDGKMDIVYKTDRGLKQVLVSLVPQPDGTYSVSVQGIPDRGTGYCLAEQKVCHYEFMAGYVHVEETLVQQGAGLRKFGSKSSPAGRVSWHEDLVLVPSESSEDFVP